MHTGSNDEEAQHLPVHIKHDPRGTCVVSLTLGTLLIVIHSLHVELIRSLKFRHYALPALSWQLFPKVDTQLLVTSSLPRPKN
jgi:hypothetical protein